MVKQPRFLFTRFSVYIPIVLMVLLWITSVAIAATDNQSQTSSKSSTDKKDVQSLEIKAEGLYIPVLDNLQRRSDNFAGNETCLTCHQDQGKSLKNTLHGRLVDIRTPAAKTDRMCETCHGPGKAHAESGDKKDIKSFKTLPASVANDTCLSCHAKNKSHIQWSGSKHDARKVSCVSCHSVHSPKSQSAQLKTVRSTETCINCHKNQALKIRKSNHMPLKEGKMECVSCHTPHGSTNEKMLKVGNSINESCVSCHTEKRGPFLFEHSPVAKNCVTCHDPHGSNNNSLLVAKVPMLCQRCHVPSRHPATIYDGTQLANASNRLLGRGCVTCHQQVHGSNSPAGHFWHR